MIKLGIKTWAHKEGYDHLKKIIDHIDVIEVMPLPDNDFYKSFKDFGIPVRIHAPHEALGANPADKDSYERTMHCFSKARKAADFLDSPLIVAHPGRYSDERTKKISFENAMHFFERFNDKRVVLENLIHLDGYVKSLCSNAGEMARLVDKFGYNICFDFAHAVLTEDSREFGYKTVLQEFMQLNPKYFHICGGSMSDYKLEHSNVFTGDFDIPFFMSLIPNESELVLETPHNIETQIRELDYLREFIL